ncbi:hypothetical protein ACJIZ3_011193 [Penstemon smallii]|uniref:Isopenicillin N synthase-like Fe(2+) 2OG dioxygenase domain-containing protein n=1 Tax=Penstemon smallii TaxID=265156 RepID=A0ABD3UK46_9LAMI
MVTKFSNAFKVNPVLDLNSLTELLETHAWTNPEIVHIFDLNNKNAIDLIGHACKTWRVFQVINHNISKNLLDEIMLGVGERGNGFLLPPHLMWSEGFIIVGSPLENAIQLRPQDYQSFYDTIEEYQKGMKKPAGKLMWLMLGSLGITEDDHTDSTILTILHQSYTRGLQVFKEGSTGWVTVPPHLGALVVYVGNLKHILSNGVPNTDLHGPLLSAKIILLQKLVDNSHPQMYMPITWSGYLCTKSKHFDKALTSVRLCAPRCGFFDTNDHKIVKV